MKLYDGPCNFIVWNNIDNKKRNTLRGSLGKTLKRVRTGLVEDYKELLENL